MFLTREGQEFMQGHTAISLVTKSEPFTSIWKHLLKSILLEPLLQMTVVYNFIHMEKRTPQLEYGSGFLPLCMVLKPQRYCSKKNSIHIFRCSQVTLRPFPPPSVTVPPVFGSDHVYVVLDLQYDGVFQVATDVTNFPRRPTFA